MLQCLTEELEAAQRLSQSLEQQLFEVQENRVVKEEAAQEQLRAEVEVSAHKGLSTVQPGCMCSGVNDGCTMHTLNSTAYNDPTLETSFCYISI